MVKRKRVLKTPKKIGGCQSKIDAFLSTLPSCSLTNFDLKRLAKKLQIKNFRGVYMRDTLPKVPWKDEKGIFNLGKKCTSGIHWVSYSKTGNLAKYFDSYGNSPPPEFIRYLQGVRVTQNRKRYQKPGAVNCGQLCLAFLSQVFK